MRGKAGTQNILHENLTSGKAQLLFRLIKGSNGRACYLAEIDIVEANDHQIIWDADMVMFSGVYNFCGKKKGPRKHGHRPNLGSKKQRKDRISHGVANFRDIYNP